MALLDGKNVAKTVREELHGRAAQFEKRKGRQPVLDVVLVGDDPASRIYVSNKEKACKKAGITSHTHLLPADTSAHKLIELVRNLNADDAVDGIIVQLPLPSHLDPDVIVRTIGPAKDVDGFHPMNLGRLFAGKPGLMPCTPLGCMRLIDETGVDLKGKNAVVVGRSVTVGKPMSIMLLERHATVTMCHSRTEKLAHVVAEADVVIAAIGKPEVIKGDWIKKGAIVIDVGINRLEDGTIVGDVEFATAAARASWITPVPGGVGPMTVAFLLSNTIKAAEQRLG